MLNYNKINNLLSNKNLSKDDFYLKIDMTSSGFIKMMENKRMKVETLEKIARYFDKPVSWFFDEYESNEVSSILNESTAEYGSTNYKEKYYNAIEQLNQALKELNDLRKDKDKSAKTNNPGIHK